MLRKFIRRTLWDKGYEVVKRDDQTDIIEKDFWEAYSKIINITASNLSRMYNLYNSVQYIVEAKIPGDLVECGVFSGGNPFLMARALIKLNDTSRRIYCYDTFAGMSKPIDIDRNYKGKSAFIEWQEKQREGHNEWQYAPLEKVQKLLFSSGYPKEKFVFVKGKVEDTIPGTIPEKIALLRLDTDFYESTLHELLHLFPKLSDKGIFIIDDYGYWDGCREAVDSYFEKNNVSMFLHRLDHSLRMGLKTES